MDVYGRPVRINFGKGGKKPEWGATPTAGANGRVQRPYKPAGEKPEGCLEIFCGNLPWSITEEKIGEFFWGVGATVISTR